MVLAISSLQQLVVGDGGDRGLLGLGDSGIVFYTPKQAGAVTFYFLRAPYPLAKGWIFTKFLLDFYTIF